jgi:hypothetical protein
MKHVFAYLLQKLMHLQLSFFSWEKISSMFVIARSSSEAIRLSTVSADKIFVYKDCANLQNISTPIIKT